MDADQAHEVNQALQETYLRDPTDPSICVIDGYGVKVTVQYGHLEIHDGIGAHRRIRKYPKALHGLKRVVLIGHTGHITLEALYWLHNSGIPLHHIDHDGTPLYGSSAFGHEDARLRRAQALAYNSDAGLAITKNLLAAKLSGQSDVARTTLNADRIADTIDNLSADIIVAGTLGDARQIESAAANVYFNAWIGNVEIVFARKHRDGIPAHWSVFTGRRSPLTSGVAAYRAADPINALLNYLYALGASEARLAALTMGLDPSLGLLHVDIQYRPSLAFDLLEPLRPEIDRYVLELLEGHIFRRADFYEANDGACRIVPPLTHRLAATLPKWAHAVAPWTEYTAHALADASGKPIDKRTPLTRAHVTRKRVKRQTTPKLTKRRQCASCGKPVESKIRIYCKAYWPKHSSPTLEDSQGSISSGSALSELVVQGKERAKLRHIESVGLKPNDYDEFIRPQLQRFTIAQICQATGLSQPSGSGIRLGVRTPHPKHWPALLDLVNTAPCDTSQRLFGDQPSADSGS